MLWRSWVLPCPLPPSTCICSKRVWKGMVQGCDTLKNLRNGVLVKYFSAISSGASSLQSFEKTGCFDVGFLGSILETVKTLDCMVSRRCQNSLASAVRTI